MKTKLSRRSYLAFVTLLAFVALIALNMGISRLDKSTYLRLDFSPDGVSSISERSVKLLNSLNEELLITVVRSYGAQSALGSLVDELLVRYTAISEHVTVEYADPSLSPHILSKLNPSGRKVDENTIFLSVRSGSRVRRIDAGQLTYQRMLDGTLYNLFCGDARISGMLINLLNDNNANAYFLSGHGETPIGECSRFSILLEAMGYETGALALNAVTPSENDLLIIIAPRVDLTNREAALLVNFLDSGGRMLVAMDALTPFESLGTFMEVLDIYGLGYERGVVAESISETEYYIDNPVWLRPQKIGDRDTLTDVDGRIIFTNSCALKSPRFMSAYTTESLLSTSDKAYRKLMDGDVFTFERGDASGRQLLALLCESNDENGARVALLSSASILYDDSEIDGKNLMDISANLDFVNALTSALKGEESLNASSELKAIPTNLITFADEKEQLTVIALCVTLLPATLIVICVIALTVRRRRAR